MWRLKQNPFCCGDSYVDAIAEFTRTLEIAGKQPVEGPSVEGDYPAF